jgi:predicted ArsR family transcriptional regulator
VFVQREALAAVAALNEDVRRALYEHVRSAGEPVSREAAADAVGISRKLAAFHLDKLVDLGLLRSGFAASGTRRVGRAPRLYEPGAIDVCVRIPARSPELIADILVSAVTEHDGGEQATAAALRIARERGAEVGCAARAAARPGRIGAERAIALAERVLAEQGFEPYRAGSAVRLRNCPFHPFAARAPEFVCGLNREYVRGLLDGMGAGERAIAELSPLPGECCVQLRAERG